MKMHHLDEDKVKVIMLKVKEVIDSGEYPPDKIEEIFSVISIKISILCEEFEAFCLMISLIKRLAHHY